MYVPAPQPASSQRLAGAGRRMVRQPETGELAIPRGQSAFRPAGDAGIVVANGRKALETAAPVFLEPRVVRAHAAAPRARRRRDIEVDALSKTPLPRARC